MYYNAKCICGWQTPSVYTLKKIDWVLFDAHQEECEKWQSFIPF